MKSITIRLSDDDYQRAEDLARLLEARARESGLGLIMRSNGVPVGRVVQDAAVLGLRKLCLQNGLNASGPYESRVVVSTQAAEPVPEPEEALDAPDDPGSYPDPDEDFDI